MTSPMRIKYLQFLEHCQEKGFWSACRMTLYKFEEAVPVEKDLNSLRPVKAPAGRQPEILDLGPENFRTLDLYYPQASRKERAERNFGLGYRSLAMVRDREVLGDLWYVTRQTSRTDGIHPHLQWFSIDLGPKDVYMFDMHVNARERGSALTTWFLGSVLHELARRGLSKSYGYFDANNVPALWVHRLIGYRERPHYIIRRFFRYETAKAKT